MKSFSPKRRYVNADKASVKGSRGQRLYRLLHVTQLMLPLLSVLRARSCLAPATMICRSFVGAFIAAQAVVTVSYAAESLLIGNVPGDQDSPSAALGANGGYIVWEDNRVQAGKEGKGIAAAAVTSDLQSVGSAFRVSSQKEGRQERPQVVALAGGEHLIVWEVRNGKNPGLFARVLGTNGTFGSGDVMINLPTVKFTQKVSTNWTAPYRGVVKPRKHKFKELVTNTREQAGAASVAALPDGGAVVAYHAVRRSDTNSWRLEERTLLSKGQFIQDSVLRPYRIGVDCMSDVFLQRLDAKGNKVGGEILVNQSIDYNQRTPSVVRLSGGGLVVAWVSERPGGISGTGNFRIGIVARLFNEEGQPTSDEFAVETADNYFQANPVLAAEPSGGFLICWSQQDGIGSGSDIYARSFLQDGSASGPSFRVNGFTAGAQYGPRIAHSGHVGLVTWTSVGQDGSREGIFGRRLRSGALFGDEFRVNETTVSRQWHPSVVGNGNGQIAVLWSGYSGSTGLDLFGSLFSIDGE